MRSTIILGQLAKLTLRLIWSALPWVALILVLVWVYGLLTGEGFPPIGPRASGIQATPTITTNPAVLEAIRSVNKQVFIEHYSVVDISYSEAPAAWAAQLGIKQEFVALIRGRVPAGFDLQQLTEADIWISADGRRAQLTLPPPTIFNENVAIDFENSRIIAQTDTCPDLLCSDSLESYQSDVLPTGKDLLIEFAQENGILDQTARDGKLYYEQFLKSLGFDEVRVIIPGYE